MGTSAADPHCAGPGRHPERADFRLARSARPAGPLAQAPGAPATPGSACRAGDGSAWAAGEEGVGRRVAGRALRANLGCFCLPGNHDGHGLSQKWRRLPFQREAGAVSAGHREDLEPRNTEFRPPGQNGCGKGLRRKLAVVAITVGAGKEAMVNEGVLTAEEIARVAGVARGTVSGWRRRHPDFPLQSAGQEMARSLTGPRSRRGWRAPADGNSRQTPDSGAR